MSQILRYKSETRYDYVLFPQFADSEYKVGKHGEEKKSADDNGPGDLIEMPRITSPDHGDTMLVHGITIYQDSNADKSVHVCKVARDGIFGGVIERHCKRAYQDRYVEVRDPRAFVCEPNLALDPHRRWDLLGDAHLRRDGNGMIVPHGGHLAVLIRRSDIGNLVRAGVALGTA